MPFIVLQIAVIRMPANIVPTMPEAWKRPTLLPTSGPLYQLPMMYCVPLYVEASAIPWKKRTAASWEKLLHAPQAIVRRAQTKVIRGNQMRGATFWMTRPWGTCPMISATCEILY